MLLDKAVGFRGNVGYHATHLSTNKFFKKPVMDQLLKKRTSKETQNMESSSMGGDMMDNGKNNAREIKDPTTT